MHTFPHLPTTLSRLTTISPPGAKNRKTCTTPITKALLIL
ncbi:hypothetical protein MNB_SUP05-SYMBIONT-5-1445 [hydrothermal vent metagenome]|uniref:Uncharacterized protein n=1 Tax=hydrothermal vent metagenome TaxID=652676 RepID=A0A1W1E252_9ZZZZ